MPLKGFPVICPFCQQAMMWLYYCHKDKITYYSANDLHCFNQIASPDKMIENFVDQHPNEPAYYFREHNKLYTLPEMERIAKLKAFL
jgi:hypothetical protein